MMDCYYYYYLEKFFGGGGGGGDGRVCRVFRGFKVECLSLALFRVDKQVSRPKSIFMRYIFKC